MFAKITVLLSLNIAAIAKEKSFLNLKQVIRGALDVVAAVPTSAPVDYNFANPFQVSASNGIQGIDPIIREKLSRLFHIPPDFVHRLAAQAGFIDYEPTTAKPYSNYWLKPKSYVSRLNPEYTTGSAFIQEDPSIALNSANDLSRVIQQQRYYQPLGILPQGSQPKMIVYGGRFYIATPFLSEKLTQQEINPVMQNSSEIIDNKGNDNQLSNIPNELNEKIHYYRIYAKHIKAAEDEQARTTTLQQVVVPDASPIGILGIESKTKTSSPYRKVYREEFENYDTPHQFNLQKQLQEVNDNLAQQYLAGNGDAINFQMAKSVTPHNRPAKNVANFAGKTEKSNLQSYQLSLNEDFKNYERIDNKSIDRAVKEQTTTSTQKTDKFIIRTIEEDANTEFSDATQSIQRILALRRRMAADRKKFAERKRLLISMKRKVNKEDAEREI